jgi:hypothetical protein
MISFINKFLMKFGYVVLPFNDCMDVLTRNAVYANHIQEHLEPGQVAYYNNETHKLEIGIKH